MEIKNCTDEKTSSDIMYLNGLVEKYFDYFPGHVHIIDKLLKWRRTQVILKFTVKANIFEYTIYSNHKNMVKANLTITHLEYGVFRFNMYSWMFTNKEKRDYKAAVNPIKGGCKFTHP